MFTDREKAIFLLGIDLAARARVPRVIHDALDGVWFDHNDPTVELHIKALRYEIRPDIMLAAMEALEYIQNHGARERLQADMAIVDRTIIERELHAFDVICAVPPDIFDEQPVFEPMPDRRSRK